MPLNSYLLCGLSDKLTHFVSTNVICLLQVVYGEL